MWCFGTRSRADPPHRCHPSAPILLTLRVVLPPLRHPEAAEPHVPEDEGALRREGVACPGETCASPWRDSGGRRQRGSSLPSLALSFVSRGAAGRGDATGRCGVRAGLTLGVCGAVSPLGFHSGPNPP